MTGNEYMELVFFSLGKPWMSDTAVETSDVNLYASSCHLLAIYEGIGTGPTCLDVFDISKCVQISRTPNAPLENGR